MAYVVPFEVGDVSYQESLEMLHASLRFGIVPLLETVVDMLAELGNPDRHFRSLQVAGTNGKTSTSRYTAAILIGEGLRCALYTSPELVSYTERMEVDGRPVSGAAFAHGIACAREAGRRVNERRAAEGLRPYDVTEFDTLTVAACVIFAEAEVDVAVLECGMGGRWDATSAVSTIESVAVTGIGLDHMRILGDTVEAIAAEKAAIIQRGRTCVLGVGCALPTTVEDVFLERAEAEGVVPAYVRSREAADVVGIMAEGTPREHAGLPRVEYRVTARPSRLGRPLVFDVRTPQATYADLGCLKPRYQAANVACAIALAEQFLGRALDAEALFESVATCPTPGRFDLVRPDPVGLVDACHNPQSVETFLAAFDDVCPAGEGRPTLLLAVLADKDVDGICRLAAGAFDRVVCTRTSSARALAACDLAEVMKSQGVEPVAVFEDLEEAVASVATEPFVAFGSITLAGEVAALFGRGAVA